MTTISDRLRELRLYGGHLFTDQDGEALTALLDHRERRTRGEIGTNYLTTAPTVQKGPTPGTYELTIGAFRGVSNRRPLYQDTAINVPLNEITAGTHIGNAVVTGGPGLSRYLVVTAEWVANVYDDRKDDNQQSVHLKADDGVFYRVFGGSESATPTLPAADLAAAIQNTGAIPVAVVLLSFGDTEINADNIYPYESYVAHIEDTITAVRSLAASMLSNNACAWVRRVPVTPVSDENDLRKIAMSPQAAAAGGRVALDASADRYVIGIDGQVRWIVPNDAPYQTADLDVSSTYFLRCRIGLYGKLEFYTQKGALPQADGETYDAYPADLRGTPDATSGGGFPSTAKDLLIGIIETDTAGTVPTWTPLYSGDFTYEATFGYADNPFAVPITIPTPFSCEYDVRVEYTTANRNPVAPTANHAVFFPVGSRTSYYNYRQVVIEAYGKWLQEVTGNLQLPSVGNTPEGRPACKITIRPKYKNVT